MCHSPTLLLFTLCLKLFQLRSLGAPLAWLFCSINKPLSFFWAVPYFLVPHDVPGWYCTFSDPALESLGGWEWPWSTKSSPFGLEFRSNLLRNQWATRKLDGTQVCQGVPKDTINNVRQAWKVVMKVGDLFPITGGGESLWHRETWFRGISATCCLGPHTLPIAIPQRD